jgi:hypothetical protein
MGCYPTVLLEALLPKADPAVRRLMARGGQHTNKLDVPEALPECKPWFPSCARRVVKLPTASPPFLEHNRKAQAQVNLTTILPIFFPAKGPVNASTSWPIPSTTVSLFFSFNYPASGWLDAFDLALLRRRLHQPVAHYRSAPRRPHRHWEPLALCVRSSRAPGPSVRIRAPIQGLPLSGPCPVHPLIPVWPVPNRISTRPARNGR